VLEMRQNGGLNSSPRLHCFLLTMLSRVKRKR
jgi:hypothetical protein